MKLGKKVSIYSLIIALLLMGLILLYLIVLMPKLYMAHMDRENLQRAKELHLGYLKERSYKNLKPPNIYSNLTFVIPKTGYKLEMEGKSWKIKVGLKDEEYKEALDKIRNQLSNKKSMNLKEEVPISPLKKLSSASFLQGMDISFEPRECPEDSDIKNSVEFIPFGRDSMLVKTQMENQGIQYTTLFLFTMEDNDIIITIVPLLTQPISSILPVVMESLPMILLVLALIVLIGSQIFSKNIINPITKLADHTNRLKSMPPSQWTNIEIKGNDEIGQLANRLNELHVQLKKNIEHLEMEKERQELFIRASSHQLKTPLASALLLTEGLIGQVGKYKDTEKYLPELKKILLSMQYMIEEMMHLRVKGDGDPKEIDLSKVVKKVFSENQLLIEEKNLTWTEKGKCTLFTWEELLEKMLEMIIGNAVVHSPVGSQIEVTLFEHGFSVKNQGLLDPNIKEHLFEPFVTGQESKGHGLGLYIAKNIGDILNGKLRIEEKDNHVILCFEVEVEK